MKKSNTPKPTLSEYLKIERFTNSCLDLQHVIHRLEQHVEVLKRSTDVNDIDAFKLGLLNFLDKSIYSYRSSLKNDTVNENEKD